MITIPEFYAYGITWNNVVCDISKVEREDDMILLFLDFYINEETFKQNKKENIFYGMLMDYFVSGINIGEEVNSNTYDYVLLSVQVMTELMNKIQFNKKEMLEAVEQSFATATDLANWLVNKLNYPFRQAYQITSKIVDYASSKKILLSEITLKEFKKFDKKITNDIFRVLSPINSMQSKSSLGGTSPQIVKKSIQHAIKKYL